MANRPITMSLTEADQDLIAELQAATARNRSQLIRLALTIAKDEIIRRYGVRDE